MVMVSYQIISLDHASLVDSSSFETKFNSVFTTSACSTYAHVYTYHHISAWLRHVWQTSWKKCKAHELYVEQIVSYLHIIHCTDISGKKNSKHKTYTRICHNANCKRIKLWCCVLFINFLAAAPTTSVQIHWATRGHKYLESKLVGFNPTQFQCHWNWIIFQFQVRYVKIKTPNNDDHMSCKSKFKSKAVLKKTRLAFLTLTFLRLIAYFVQENSPFTGILSSGLSAGAMPWNPKQETKRHKESNLLILHILTNKSSNCVIHQ